MIGFEIGFKKIGEEKELENSEDDEKLDENDNPEPFSDSHAAKAFVVKIKYLLY
jgi:hypothetical protein